MADPYRSGEATQQHHFQLIVVKPRPGFSRVKSEAAGHSKYRFESLNYDRHQCFRKNERVDGSRSDRPNLIDARQRKDGDFALGLVLIIGEPGHQLGCRVE